ncbi:hypothetical protein HanXRQr2_Chr07g0295701 [Helianthus annuus]|uniref:Uncharacterized protein n=1 Tax=Helianthus annuus TaxID=4232 RepID=A0A251RTP5_HELAN|nr:hypothetical protein HanXRQr2_Chr07g0295701 [Helianthus annuus]KAJ0904785.1 hypothetical protein HanPSC8_Chr07g0286281 [Helianthus annuus]
MSVCVRHQEQERRTRPKYHKICQIGREIEGLKHGWLTSQKKARRRARTWMHTVSEFRNLTS